MVLKHFFWHFLIQSSKNIFFFFRPFTSNFADSMSIIGKTTTCWVIKKHCEIAKRYPEYISSVVKVSSCYYQKTVLSFVRNWVVRIWVLWQFKFEFCHNFSFGFIIIWFVDFFCCLSFWFLLLFELLQFEFLGFVTIWVFEFCCYLIF